MSSDTEHPQTPLRKRFRSFDEPISRKRQRKNTQKDVDLQRLLRDCAKDSAVPKDFLQLKQISSEEHLIRPLIKTLIHSAKRSVAKRCRNRHHPLLETELYSKWLDELQYVATALNNALDAKITGTRKRVPSLGRPAFIILYNLIDEFIDQVNIHHDICSNSDLDLTLYPPTLSLIEEAKDTTTDARSEKSVQRAEASLRNLDRIMADAVRRYKSERGWCNAGLAEMVSVQEGMLARGCCLLCEQTGFGAEEEEGSALGGEGSSLMMETREVMRMWKDEYEDCEDQLDESD